LRGLNPIVRRGRNENAEGLMNQDSRAEAENAVVIGGSLAGLLAARARRLSCERVTIVERDPVERGPLGA
jgi:NADPH-dependent 2,4-dienoyl-CoA reductase/sulfur reductase-like enzyme